MKWLRRLWGGNGAAQARRDAEAKLEATKKETAAVEQLAYRVADLTDDEFANRVAQAFRRRPA
jgi:hypothetical protein